MHTIQITHYRSVQQNNLKV